jgi:hypothetical protein
VLLAVAFVALAGGATACTPHNCDPSSSSFDLGSQGIRTDLEGGRVELASSSYEGTWLDYPGNRTITVTYPAGFTPDPALPPIVSLSTGQAQDAGATSTSTAGQLDQITYPTATGFELQNGSCADYYVWFSVTGTLASGSADAGADAHD